MRSVCLAFLASVLVFTFLPAESLNNAKASDVPAIRDGSHDYDFLLGEFHVHHRVKPLREGEPWLQFDGTATQYAYLGGIANVQDYVITRPAGTSCAIAIRVYDPKTRQWAARWIDGRDPHLPLDPPEVGGFSNGIGSLYSDAVRNGKQVKTRFRY